MIKMVKIKLIVDEGTMPAIDAVREILNEGFGKEAQKETPRGKLVFAELKEKRNE